MFWFWTSVILIPLIDQIFKFKVRTELVKGAEINTFIPFFKIVNVSNFGMAFGIMKGKNWLLVIATTIIILFLCYLVFTLKDKNFLITLALAFLIGGGIGNLIDRLILGYVIDYLKITFFPPICNLSDYFVCIGMVILLFELNFKLNLKKS